MAVELTYWRYAFLCAILSTIIATIAVDRPIIILAIYVIRIASYGATLRLFDRYCSCVPPLNERQPVPGGASFIIAMSIMIAIGIINYAALTIDSDKIVVDFLHLNEKGGIYSCHNDDSIAIVAMAFYSYMLNMVISRRETPIHPTATRFLSFVFVSFLLVFFYIFSWQTCEEIFGETTRAINLKNFQIYWLITIRSAMVCSVGFGGGVIFTKIEYILLSIISRLRG